MRYPRNSPNIVSGGGCFHDMYIELDDVLWAIVVTGLPIGTEIRERERERKQRKNVILYQKAIERIIN